MKRSILSKQLRMMLIAGTTLTSCLVSEGMHLAASTADAVMQHIRQSAPTADFVDVFALTCTVTEGPACAITKPDLGQPDLPRPLSLKVIDEVGAKFIEHSEHATVQIVCSQIEARIISRWECQINRGSSWQPLPPP